ncbi:MAG TPA: copper chaperone PCu(A)C [Burkholderiales bacterium]|nr:copper chaperone PCu(A)C [Burkholderiales bacterium]
MRILVCTLLLAAAPAWAQVKIENAWARATPPGATIAAGYLTIRNASAKPDRLVSASSPAAARVAPHVTVEEGGINRMRPVKGYDIPAHGVFELTPGGAHLMLMNLKAPLKEGERVPLLLEFSHAGEVKTELEVKPLGTTGAMPGMHGAMH